MAANKKLTAVLRGRTATRVDRDGSTAIVQFDDGSAMTVQTGDDSPPASVGAGTGGRPAGEGSGASALGRVQGVRQQDTVLSLDFETGSTLTLRTAEATSSVLVRARDHTLEYAD